MKKKALLLTLSAAALVAASVFGTYAYLTDTEAVTNTFTVGQVGITLDEAPVDKDGKETTGKRVIANKYHLMPGHTYIKDPTIHVDADSEECYLFVKVENGIKDIETTDATKTIEAQMKDIGWVAVEGATDIYVLAKGENEPDYTYTVFKGAEVEVFAEFTIDGDTVDNGKIKDYAENKIIVTAYAVQAEGFDTSLDAWSATYGKS